MDYCQHKTLEDLFPKEDFEIYKLTEYPFNLALIEQALKDKLETEPDYEVFAPMVYSKCLVYEKEKKIVAPIRPYKIMISNKGRVLDLKRNVFINTRSYGENGYCVFSLAMGGKKTSHFTVHRAVACSFVGAEKGHPREFTVNHKDGNKANNDSPNLEWASALENNVHALANGLRSGISGWENNRSKPAKGVIIEGPFKGYEFIICGHKNATVSGFNMTGISFCCNGRWERYKNCTWSLATDDEIKRLPKGLSDEIRKSIDFFKGKVKSDILVTNVKTGDTFVMTRGYPEILELGFSPSSVSEVIKGRKKTHKGHYFERIPN